jgi:hypothetical protein
LLLLLLLLRILLPRLKRRLLLLLLLWGWLPLLRLPGLSRLLLLRLPTLWLVAAASQQTLHIARSMHPLSAGGYRRMQDLPAEHPQRLGEPLVACPAVRRNPLQILLTWRLQPPDEGVGCVVNCRLADISQALLSPLRRDRPPGPRCLCHPLHRMLPRWAGVHPVGVHPRRHVLLPEALLAARCKPRLHHIIKAALQPSLTLLQCRRRAQAAVLLPPYARAHPIARHPPP